MTHKAMDVYLNDHRAGATLGVDLAEQIRSRAHGTPLGDLLGSLAPQIAEDRQTLIELMARLGIATTRVKRAGAWITEKASRVKFGGLTSGEPDLGLFMALETLALGVLGKLSLWKALTHVAEQHSAIRAGELDELIKRAEGQYDALERERSAASARILNPARATA